MCDAQSTSQLGLGLETASTLGSTYAAYQGAQINRSVANANAELADWQARDAIDRGGRDELALRRKAARLSGKQRATFAAGNVDLQGSALDVLDETARNVEQDAATIRTNAQREAAGRRFEAAGYRTSAAGSSPGMAAATSLLTGAGRVADRWYDYQSSYGS